MVNDDPWSGLRRWTPARIALGRSGASLPTREVLAFALAHARARDAIHTPFRPQALAGEAAGLGLPVLCVRSAAPDRAAYLRRPDLGRLLASDGADLLRSWQGDGFDLASVDLAIVIADGLSARAVHAHAVPLLGLLVRRAAPEGWTFAPVVIATNGRVALGDQVGEMLGARCVLVLIGERPGLSSPDSLGAYLTFAPRIGRTDAERNCVSNIRPEGLPLDDAAARLTWLLREALRRRLTGVGLKDESDARTLPGL